MEKREKERQERREKERPAGERVGGGPEMTGGDTEPSNIPGETRARGMQPPEPEPVIPDETDTAP